MALLREVLDDMLRPDVVDDPARNSIKEAALTEVAPSRGRRWGKRVSLAAVALGAIGAFLAIARSIGEKKSNTFDRTLVRAIGRGRRPFVGHVARGVSFLGGVPGAVGISVGALALSRKTPQLRRQVLVGALGAVISELGIKQIYRRERPRMLEHLEVVRSSSFPSGHTMAASSLYLTLAFIASRNRHLREHRTALISGAGALATTVGVTRVYLGVHWPTDVLGGLALGTAWACGAEAVFDLTSSKKVARKRAQADLSPSLHTAMRSS